jgi:hypothetical protein
MQLVLYGVILRQLRKLERGKNMLSKFYRHKSKGYLVECITAAKLVQLQASDPPPSDMIVYRAMSGRFQQIIAVIPRDTFIEKFIPILNAQMETNTAAKLGLNPDFAVK